MLLNVRGSHGSGKTTISQRLIDEHPHDALVEPEFVEGCIRRGKKEGQPYRKNFKLPNAFALQGGVVIVGRRQAGMDGYLPHETIEDSLRYWAPRAEHLVFENVLLSANIGRWGELFTELEPVNHPVLAHLDTSWPMCKARVLQRRADGRAAGKKYRQTDAELKTDAHLAHWKRCRKTAAKARAQGFDVRWIDNCFAYELVHDALVAAGWRCPVHPEPLLPNGPFLEVWNPTTDDLALIERTIKLPWETTDPLGQPAENEAGVAPPFDGNRQPVATPAAVSTSVARSGTVFVEDIHAYMGDPFDA